MDIANYVLARLSEAVINPYTVRQCSSMDYKTSVLVQHEWNLSLYLHKEAYDCVLRNPFVENHDFRLFHLQATKKREAFGLFASMFQVLPILLHGDSKVLYDVSKIQILCQTIRENCSWSVAHVAVKTGILLMIQKDNLFDFINSQCCDKHMTAVQLACVIKRLDILKKLSEISPNYSLKDDSDETVFHYAVSKCPIEFLKFLCNDALHDRAFDIANLAGDTPLHLAIKQNKLEHVKCLLNANASTQICSKIGYVIHYAMKYNTDTTIFKLLLEKDPTLAGKLCKLHQATPMHWCRNHEHVQILRKFSPNMNLQSADGHVPVHVMVIKNRLCAAIAMTLYGTDVNCRGRHNNTALHLAVPIDDVELVKMLLLFGGDCNAANDFGETPGLLFMRSSKPNKEKIIKLLSDIGGVILNNVGCNLAKPSCQNRLHAATDGIDMDDIIIIEDSPKKSVGSDKKLRVLCLDGGGVRGLVLTQILIAIEKETGKPIKESFDWIVGTSTGAILAIALMLGKSAVDCQRIYFSLKDEVFSGSRPYNSEPMELFLKEEFGENKKMSDLVNPDGPKLLIPATLLDESPARLFLFRNYTPNYDDKPHMKTLKASVLLGTKKPHGNDDEIHPLDVPLWQIARSSGAAPSYFRPVGKFVDGGLVSNNPTLDALSEIHKCNKALRSNPTTRDQAADIGLVVSVGTGIVPPKSIKSVDIVSPTNPVAIVNSALASWELINVIVDVACECNEHVLDRAKSWCEMIDVPYFRLNPQLETEVLLNESDDKKLIDLMWETKLYAFHNQHLFKELIHLLKTV